MAIHQISRTGVSQPDAGECHPQEPFFGVAVLPPLQGMSSVYFKPQWQGGVIILCDLFPSVSHQPKKTLTHG